MTKTNTASKKYGLFNKTKYGNTNVMHITKTFTTREAAREAKREYANPLNIGIVNLKTGVTLR